MDTLNGKHIHAVSFDLTDHNPYRVHVGGVEERRVHVGDELGEGVYTVVAIDNKLDVIITHGDSISLGKSLGYDVDEEVDMMDASYYEAYLVTARDVRNTMQLVEMAIAVRDVPVSIIEDNGFIYVCPFSYNDMTSWDLCLAHIKLGYLPPIELIAKLDQVDTNKHPQYEQVKSAAKLSADAMIDWCKAIKEAPVLNI